MILVPTCPYFPSYTHTSATSYLRHAHSINKSNNTPVSQKNIPVSRVSLPVSHVSLPVSLPFRTSRSRFARLAPVSQFFFFFDWRSNKKYHPEGAALCCMVVYCTYPTLQCHSRAEMAKNFCETGTPFAVSHGRFVRFSAVPLKPSVSQGCNPWAGKPLELYSNII